VLVKTRVETLIVALYLALRAKRRSGAALALLKQ
jgi:hypothetical protein